MEASILLTYLAVFLGVVFGRLGLGTTCYIFKFSIKGPRLSGITLNVGSHLLTSCPSASGG